MENNVVQLHKFKNESEVRVIIKEGQPWFLAKDVCAALGLEARFAVRYLDSDEKSNVSKKHIGLPPGGRDLLIVSESGLYALILKSRKPDARKFKRWVTHEVLPSIRKTGAYMTPETLVAAIKDPAFLTGLLTQLSDLQQQNGKLTATLEENQTVQGFMNFHKGIYALHGSKTQLGKKATALWRDLSIKVGLEQIARASKNHASTYNLV